VVICWFLNLFYGCHADDLWMVYDDLKSTTICQFKSPFPTINASEVHIIMWRSRPARLDVTGSRNAAAVAFSTHATTSVYSVPPTATVATSALATIVVRATTASDHRMLVAHSSSPFGVWPPVIATRMRPKVSSSAFCCANVIYCCL